MSVKTHRWITFYEIIHRLGENSLNTYEGILTHLTCFSKLKYLYDLKVFLVNWQLTDADISIISLNTGNYCEIMACLPRRVFRDTFFMKFLILNYSGNVFLWTFGYLVD